MLSHHLPMSQPNDLGSAAIPAVGPPAVVILGAAPKLGVFKGAFFWLHVNPCYGSQIPSWWFFTNPFEKYARQIGSFPQVGVQIRNI